MAGRGPSALMAALLAKAQPEGRDTQFYLTDMRAPHDELIQFALKHDTFSILDAIKSPVTGQSAFQRLHDRGHIQYLRGTQVGDSFGRITVNHPNIRKGGEVSGKRAHLGARESIQQQPVGLLSKNHLMTVLMEIAGETPGVHMMDGIKPVLGESEHVAVDGQPMHSVSLQPVARTDAGWTPYGKAIDIGTPDLIVASDGKNSDTLRQAGIKTTKGRSMGTFIAGSVEIPRRAGDNKALSRPQKDAEGRDIKVYDVHSGGDGEAWIIVETHDRLDPGEDADAHFRRHAAQALKKKPEDLKVRYVGGKARPFRLQPTLAETIGRGNLVAHGDAYDTSTFEVQGGIASGAHTAAAFATKFLAPRNRARSPEEAAKADALGKKYMQNAAHGWLKVGSRPFIDYVLHQAKKSAEA